jgi:hypothetical protein
MMGQCPLLLLRIVDTESDQSWVNKFVRLANGGDCSGEEGRVGGFLSGRGGRFFEESVELPSERGRELTQLVTAASSCTLIRVLETRRLN